MREPRSERFGVFSFSGVDKKIAVLYGEGMTNYDCFPDELPDRFDASYTLTQLRIADHTGQVPEVFDFEEQDEDAVDSVPSYMCDSCEAIFYDPEYLDSYHLCYDCNGEGAYDDAINLKIDIARGK